MTLKTERGCGWAAKDHVYARLERLSSSDVALGVGLGLTLYEPYLNSGIGSRWYLTLRVDVLRWQVCAGVRFRLVEQLLKRRPECFYSVDSLTRCERGGMTYTVDENGRVQDAGMADCCDNCKWGGVKK